MAWDGWKSMQKQRNLFESKAAFHRFLKKNCSATRVLDRQTGVHPSPPISTHLHPPPPITTWPRRRPNPQILGIWWFLRFSAKNWRPSDFALFSCFRRRPSVFGAKLQSLVLSARPSVFGAKLQSLVLSAPSKRFRRHWADF